MGNHNVRLFERPPLWVRGGAFLLGGLLTLVAWNERGAILDLVALVVFGGGLGAFAAAPDKVRTWGEGHAYLAPLYFFPSTFLSLAVLTDFETPIALLVSAAASGLLLVVGALFKE